MRWLEFSQSNSTKLVQFNIAIGTSNTQQSNDVVLASSLAPPILPTMNQSLVVSDDQLDIFSALKFNYQLSGAPLGRDIELNRIINWAISDDPRALLRVVTGRGGVGKTRLALEAGTKLLESGWISFFAEEATQYNFQIEDKAGLFIIVDYPEERNDISAIINYFCSNPSYIELKIRILLLTRQDFNDVKPQFLKIRDRVGAEAIATLTPLNVDDAYGVIQMTKTNISRVLDTPINDVREEDCRNWLSLKEVNRVPLYLVAAAIHSAYVNPQFNFDLPLGNIIQALIDRELRRINACSVKLGFGENSISKLLALSTLYGGLSVSRIEKLSQNCYHIFSDNAPDVVNKIMTTSWWDQSEGILQPIQPDPVGAAFISRIIGNTPEDIRTRWEQLFLDDNI